MKGKELQGKLREIDKLREFIQNVQKEKEKNFELFIDKINEVKERIFKEVMRKKYKRQMTEQKIMTNLLKDGTLPIDLTLGGIAFCEPKYKYIGYLCEEDYIILQGSFHLAEWKNQNTQGI